MAKKHSHLGVSFVSSLCSASTQFLASIFKPFVLEARVFEPQIVLLCLWVYASL